jgi:hypothetical protein
MFPASPVLITSHLRISFDVTNGTQMLTFVMNLFFILLLIWLDLWIQQQKYFRKEINLFERMQAKTFSLSILQKIKILEILLKIYNYVVHKPLLRRTCSQQNGIQHLILPRDSSSINRNYNSKSKEQFKFLLKNSQYSYETNSQNIKIGKIKKKKKKKKKKSSSSSEHYITVFLFYY